MTDTKTPATIQQMGDMTGLARMQALKAPVRLEGMDIDVPTWCSVFPWDPDTDAIAERIAMKAFEAETVDDMLTEHPPEDIESLLGSHIRITNASLTRSTVENDNALGVYLVIEYTNLEDGAKAVTTTSAKGIMMQIANAIVHGWLPMDCTVVEVNTGKNGRSNPMHLARYVAGMEKGRAF